MDELDKEMKLSFIDEARQLLGEAEQCFLDLETNMGEPEVIENLFRLAHNMKGTSRAVGFGEVAEFTHQLENLLLKLKEKTLAVDDETVNLLLECNDHLTHMVETLSSDLEATFDSTELCQKIAIKLDGGSIGNVMSSSTSIEEGFIPSVEDFERSGVDLGDEGLPVPRAADFDSQEEYSHEKNFKPSIEMVEEDPIPLDSVPQFPLAHQSAANSIPTNAPSGAGAPPASSGGGAKKSATSNNSQTDESIRVSLSRLEKLGNFIGELVILQTVLNQHRQEITSQLLQRTIGQLGKLSKEIQDISMSLRMIPLKQTFAKLQRIVRDTSKALGKTVELSLIGEQTEVDKTVLEHISDPLVHIVRNAIDHGLEMPDERATVGKSQAGRVQIRAFHQGNNLVIEVRDDGKGVEAKKLLQKSIEKGIVPPGTTMSDQDALNLIFMPGFSTKDQVSEISGRGVGLDVVKTNVERLGGSVQLESTVGQGSCFRIILPLTLAIVDGMVVQVSEERYVVPIANVHETVQPRREDIHYVTGRGEMLTLRDRVLPLFRLSQLLKINLPADKVRDSHSSIAIVANSRKEPFAVLVDDIIRQQQIVIKKLGAEIREQKGLSGSAILGDGRPALILDLNDLAEKAMSAAGPSQQNSTRSNRMRAA